MRHLPPLSALPAFEATARLGSVTAAAAELGRTHSAISKQLRHLGEDLGGALFEKDGTGLRLTQRGAQLQAELRPMLDRLDHVAQLLRQQQDQRRVRLAVSATFATRWLTPRLPRFYAQHPDVEVDLLMSGPHRDMRDTYDLILSYDRLRGPLQDTRKPEILGDTSYGPVCAPGYPLVQSPEGWRAELRLVHAGAPQSWDAWCRLSGMALIAARESAYPHHILALEAAAAGLGVAVAERHRDLHSFPTRRSSDLACLCVSPMACRRSSPRRVRPAASTNMRCARCWTGCAPASPKKTHRISRRQTPDPA